MAAQDRADAERTFSPNQAQAKSTRKPGGGGRREMDLQRNEEALVEPRAFEKEAADPRFGETEPSVDPRHIGEPDNPQNDWGDASGDDGMTYGANHTRRPIHAEAERAQGPKTRARTKDILSRRE